MIENFKNLILSYEEEYHEILESGILSREIKFPPEVTERTVLINERIKVSYTFTYFIMERCLPSQVAPLRKLVEEYEKNVALIKDDELSGDVYFDIKDITVILDVLFGIDVTYLSNLYRLIQEGKMEKVTKYLEDNISCDLSYDGLINAVKGYDKSYRR